MVSSNLILHRGARLVSREELDAIPVPEATETWFPLSHSQVLTRVTASLQGAGFTPSRTQLAVMRDGSRFFATIDLTTPLYGGDVTLAIGVRNSIDKSLPISFCAGNRVFICDNLAFRSEIVVSRKHTKNGETRFNEAVCRAVQSLHKFREAEAARIKHFAHLSVCDTVAEALMLRAFEAGIVSHRLLPRLIQEWRTPSFEEFSGRTFWSLENAFTAVLAAVGKSNPQRFCALSLQLQGLLDQAAGPAPITLAA